MKPHEGCGWGLCCFTDKTVEVSAEGLKNWKASLLPVTLWTISPEGKVHHQRGQFNAHPRFQNEENTEKKVCEKFRSMIKKVQKKVKHHRK